MPSIESIGAISSLGGRAIDSSCPWLVKGMRRCKSIQIDRGVPNQQQALSNVLGEGSAGESPIDPIFLIAPHSSRPGTKKSLRWADANLDLSTEQFHSSRSLNPIFNVPSPPCLTPSIFLSGVSQAAKPFILIKERVFPPSINGIGLSELLTAVKANREIDRRISTFTPGVSLPCRQRRMRIDKVFLGLQIAEAKKSNQCSFRAQPKDPILAAAGALDGTGKTVHE
ncbi:hypothetical protein L1887_51797 [Cichorium endivia]|nr:hypothetical protein L1887_51797 [Cichorium endivia]